MGNPQLPWDELDATWDEVEKHQQNPEECLLGLEAKLAGLVEQAGLPNLATGLFAFIGRGLGRHVHSMFSLLCCYRVQKHAPSHMHNYASAAGRVPKPFLLSFAARYYGGGAYWRHCCTSSSALGAPAQLSQQAVSPPPTWQDPAWLPAESRH